MDHFIPLFKTPYNFKTHFRIQNGSFPTHFLCYQTGLSLPPSSAGGGFLIPSLMYLIDCPAELYSEAPKDHYLPLPPCEGPCFISTVLTKAVANLSKHLSVSYNL